MELVADSQKCVSVIRSISYPRIKKIPLSESVERFVGCSGNDGDLIAANSVHEPTALNNCLRANEDEIDLVHGICDCGI